MPAPGTVAALNFRSSACAEAAASSSTTVTVIFIECGTQRAVRQALFLRYDVRMSTSRMFAAVSLLALTGCTIGAASSKVTDETLFLGGTVAAGSSQTPQKNAAILVRDGRIVEVASAATLRALHPSARI